MMKEYIKLIHMYVFIGQEHSRLTDHRYPQNINDPTTSQANLNNTQSPPNTRYPSRSLEAPAKKQFTIGRMMKAKLVHPETLSQTERSKLILQFQIGRWEQEQSLQAKQKSPIMRGSIVKRMRLAQMGAFIPN